MNVGEDASMALKLRKKNADAGKDSQETVTYIELWAFLIIMSMKEVCLLVGTDAEIAGAPTLDGLQPSMDSCIPGYSQFKL